MKLISFLYSFKTKKLPQRALLLVGNKIAIIDEMVSEDERLGSDKAQKVIKDSTVQSATWWWPAGRAFREMQGVPEYAVLNLLKEYGFVLSSACRLEHQQVEEDEPLMDGYIEVKLSISDEKYTELCKEYGNIKVI